jgi:hypothetical protein
MKRILELNLGAMILLTFAVGCGGNSSDPGSGGASSSAGNAGANAGAGGTSAMPGGGAHSSGGQSSMPGSAGAAPGGGFSTSVPGSTPLKDLTPEQAAQLCSDLQKYADTSLSPPLADYECKALGLVAAAQATTDAAAQSACKTSRTQCAPTTTTGTGMCDTSEAATCTATVADATVCLNDTAAAVAALAASVPSCDGMTLAQAQAALGALATGGLELTNPPSCTKYQAECPGSMSGMP